MHYRQYGRTGRSISLFSLGLMRCLDSAAQLEAVIAAAWQLGINHFETAQSYGPSEAYLATALRSLQLPRDQVVITTKILPDRDPQQMVDAVLRSRDRLGIDRIDCLALHGLNQPEHLQQAIAALPVLQALQADGVFQHLGFSSHGDRELILQAIATDAFDFVSLHYYLLFQRHAPVIEAAAARNLGIFIISPVDKGGLLHQPSQQLIADCHPFSPLALNYRFLLSDRRITTLSFGAAKPEELAVLQDFVDADQPLSPEETDAIARLEQVRQQRLGTDYCQQCYACLPCPEAINIPEVLRLRNLAIAHDMQAYGQYRYRMFENAGHWFPGQRGSRCTDCGDCLPRCPHHLPIADLVRDADQRLAGAPRRRLWGD
ncbi:aldo/keto reductase [Synechococcus elongatus IITB7]|uniref:aldo/keto reductase n=1 Tax=Synechococcus elongatus TaxID=32046 RepID=UPI0030D24E8F